ncbi:ead/Ea22-like family protein [Enterobacter hormaechei]|uniref:ead/Ea22-like family protein n=1 Tax=Enterobacter hormaechei TaxID=158836 RepID=UPI002DBEB20D|nr:ead/Ea22-like family protein [Enterobacter hormaechei]MEB5634524.1 ead/Ea22-like family protein [Enterobacter hormaechei]
MSNIDKLALREAAVRAGGVKWQYMRATQHSKAYITDDKGSTVVNCADGDVPAKCAGFLESANPAAVLTLLDELEAKDNRINRLEAIVAVAEQRNALMREWKRDLKVPCDLVDDQVPVVIHGMVIRLERLKEAEAKLEAAEKRIAELEELEELFLRAKALMHQSGGTPIENSLNPVDAWLYEAENATAGKGE